jgi:signal transduction histidine kinase
MGLRRRSIRLRIFLLVIIPILSLIGLYVFAAGSAAGNAINLSRTDTVKNVIGLPVGTLQVQLDTESLFAVTYLANPVPLSLATLRAQETQTDGAASVLRSASAKTSFTARQKQADTALIRDTTNGLQALRSRVASRTISRPQTITAYSDIVTTADTLLMQLIASETDVPIVMQGLALEDMNKAEGLILQEDALLVGDMAARSFSAPDRQKFAELVGARRVLVAQTLPDLDPIYRAYYERDVSPQASAALAALENTVINDRRAGPVPPVSPAAWTAAVGAVGAGIEQAGRQAASELTARAQPVADATYLRLILVGGLGLLAILLSVMLSIWIGRGLLAQLAELRRSALKLANERLPNVIERLRAGQDVDVSAEAPPMEPDTDEVGQVKAAFNAVQRAAVAAAVDEAKLRRGIGQVFRNLARRSQSLLHRQLALLDAMERRASDPAELEDLFRIDHLTTRMRRHAEGLIILSGEAPGRGWRHPVRLVDVLRAAVAEVEDYTRIRVTTGTQAALIGPAVADVIHLIAELAENATTFSPPNAPVRIHGDIVGRGFAVEIEDRGLGIAEEKLAKINHDLEHPLQFDLSGSDQLGLFVAGQLARRHEIRITLQPSPYGGITAIVLIPKALIVDNAEASAVAASERAIRLTGRHGSLNHGMIAEPAALAQLTASTSADGQPGPAGELPSGTAGELPSGAAGELPSGAAGELPSGAAGELPSGPAADTPTVPAVQADSIFTPRRPRAASAAAADGGSATADGSSFGFSGHGPQGYPADPEAADPRVSTTELTNLGLPVRVRQASLAPQLRDGARLADPAEKAPGGPSPEAARSTMTALQRGWERGRYISGAPVPSFDTTQNAEPSGDGDEQRNDD